MILSGNKIMLDEERIIYNKVSSVNAALNYAKRKGIFKSKCELNDLKKMIELVKKFNWEYNKLMIKDIMNIINDYLNNRYTSDEARLQIYYITGYEEYRDNEE